MNNNDIKTTILELETRLTLAERDANKSELEELLASDFSGVLVNGVEVNKEGFVAAFCNSGIRFYSLEIEDVQIEIENDSVLVRGRSVYALELHGNKLDGSGLFEDTWVKISDEWKLKSAIVKPM